MALVHDGTSADQRRVDSVDACRVVLVVVGVLCTVLFNILFAMMGHRSHPPGGKVSQAEAEQDTRA
jgi:hypothetical protein